MSLRASRKPRDKLCGKAYAPLMTKIENLCAERGLKMTGQRRVIIRVLSEAQDHPNVDEIYRRASAIDPKISIATVYRTMRLFEHEKVIERLDFGERKARYERHSPEHHHHLIDIDTGEVIEFQDEGIEDLKKRIAARLGYELAGDRLELFGVRINKKAQKGSPPPSK